MLITHKLPGSKGRMDNQIGHVSDQIRCQSKIKHHVEHDEYHLIVINSMQITISSGSERGYRPVKGFDITNPQALGMKIFPNGPNPCFTWILVICS